MRVTKTILLSASILLWTVPGAMALQWICPVPEIDGPAGLSALAVLASLGAMAYERYKG